MNQTTLDSPIVDSADGSALNPREFVAFDNGGLTVDRYTILPYFNNLTLSDAERGVALAVSEKPDTPQGYTQWVEMSARAVKSRAIDLGRQITWEDLPSAVRSHARFRLGEEGGTFDEVAPEIASRQRLGM